MQIPAAKIYFPPEDRQDLAVKIGGILETGQLTLGKYTKEFEERFAASTGTAHAVAVNSGTSALEIILRGLDVKGSTVLVPTNTFFATPASVVHAGGKVRFVDAAPNLSMDADRVNEAVDRDTKGVILVHIGGAVAPQVREIREICEDRGLFLVEDAAHAHGSTLAGKKAGSFGVAGAFSFYPTKVMTSGEGGMITTDDRKLCERALVFRDQGKAGFLGNIHTEMGYNWRMSEVHAAIGLSQFGRLEEFVAARRRIAAVYDRHIGEVPGLSPIPVDGAGRSNYYKYCALPAEGTDRAALKKELKEKHGVSLSGEVYELPCHLQPVFKEGSGAGEGAFPVAEDLCRRHICLPVYATMKDEEAMYVIESLKKVLA
jgi:perosamine synthetase